MKVRNAGHRSGPLKQQNKAHKTGRHRSKSQIDRESKGKSSLQGITKKSKKQLSRVARKHRANQLRLLKREETLNKKRGLGEPCSPPFLVAVVSLCDDLNAESALKLLISSLGEETSATYCERGIVFVNVTRFKQRFSFFFPNQAALYDVLDCMKVADTVAFIWPVDGELDAETSTLLSTLKAQGLPTCLNIACGMGQLSGKKKELCRRSLSKNLEKWSFEPKIFQLESDSDGLSVMRHIGSCTKKPLNLQKHRAHMLVERCDWHVAKEKSDLGTVKLYGYVRGRGLNVNQLIHLTGLGDFQLSKIEVLHDPRPLNIHRKDKLADANMLDEDSSCFIADPNSRESLASEVIPDPMHGEQTWPTEHELKDSDIASLNQKGGNKRKKVPAGTSDYQAAWITDKGAEGSSADEDEETDEDDESHAGDENMEPNDEELSQVADDNAMDETESIAITETENTEKYDVKFDEEEEKRLLKEFREQRENELFPDEVDTPMDIAARIRFQRYRGLKSFRTSPWNRKENLPYDYARIFKFENFRRTKKRVLSEEVESPVQEGSYVCIHVENVSKSKFDSLGQTSPLVAYGMLPHEQKISLLNIVLRKHESYSWSIKSKERLVFHVGYRRFYAAPIFSQHTNGDKFKYERFMPNDSTVVASIYAPITFPPCSVLVFKQDVKGKHRLVATGALFSVNPDRVVVKRIILSGHPFKIHKRMAVIRYMFFNREDIDWFKPIELRTKYGKRGHIKDALGTHGHTKCIFDRPVNSQDTVLMDLYKRVFPKWTYDPVVDRPAVDLNHDRDSRFDSCSDMVE